MNKQAYDVTVIGGGPAGLAAAISASKSGARVLLIEREDRLGGVLKQCIHDGFGVIRFGEKLSGCEYAMRFIHELEDTDAEVRTLTFASQIDNLTDGFALSLTQRDGFERVFTRTLILATGCRERTAKQVSIHGTRPAGVLTAGAAQYFINVLGQLPGKNCVILGSGDIGLIMARRLTLEGARVLGVYEAKGEPSGLMRNIYQCLVDFDIPLHLSHTVTEVHGRERLCGVTVCQVDDRMEPVAGTQKYIPCDTLILSVGLIPENELAESLGASISKKTKGPLADEDYMTSVPGLFSCGNALHVNDLVDYVSESGEKSGTAAAEYAANRVQSPNYASIGADENFAYIVPARVSADTKARLSFFFRTRQTRGATTVKAYAGKQLIFSQKYTGLRPPEMERIEIDFSQITVSEDLYFVMEEAEHE